MKVLRPRTLPVELGEGFGSFAADIFFADRGARLGRPLLVGAGAYFGHFFAVQLLRDFRIEFRLLALPLIRRFVAGGAWQHRRDDKTKDS